MANAKMRIIKYERERERERENTYCNCKLCH